MGYYPFPRINTISHQPVDNKLSSLLLFSESVTKCTYAAMLPELRRCWCLKRDDNYIGYHMLINGKVHGIHVSARGQDHYTAMVDPCIYHIDLLLPRILLL